MLHHQSDSDISLGSRSIASPSLQETLWTVSCDYYRPYTTRSLLLDSLTEKNYVCIRLYVSTVNCELPLQPNLPTGMNKHASHLSFQLLKKIKKPDSFMAEHLLQLLYHLQLTFELIHSSITSSCVCCSTF